MCWSRRSHRVISSRLFCYVLRALWRRFTRQSIFFTIKSMPFTLCLEPTIFLAAALSIHDNKCDLSYYCKTLVLFHYLYLLSIFLFPCLLFIVCFWIHKTVVCCSVYIDTIYLSPVLYVLSLYLYLIYYMCHQRYTCLWCH